MGKRKVTFDDITPTMNVILDGQSAVYATIGNTLPRHQKRVLIAIAASGGEKIFSHDFIRDNDLGAVSSVQTSINLLMKKEIVEKASNIYYITDVFFKSWIKKAMT